MAADTQYYQYVAFQTGTGERDEPTRANTWNIHVGGTTYTYIRTTVNMPDGSTQTYWVRDGYHITITNNEEDKRFGGAADGTVVHVYRDDDWTEANGNGLLSSLQLETTDMGVTTLNGDNLLDVSAGTFVGASNSPSTAVSVAEDKNQIFVYSSSRQQWIDVGSNTINLNRYFHEVTYDSTLGGYTYNGQLIDPKDMYVIDGRTGVFVVDNEVYSGSVFGYNNEILVTGRDDEGEYYSYWGAERNDPNETIGDKLTVGQYNETISTLNSNVKSVAKDSIKEIQLAQNEDGNGGTIGLLTNGDFETVTIDGKTYYVPKGGESIPGGITVTSSGGTNGNDVQITFANQTDPDDESTKSSFSINAGSKVVANDTTGTNKGTLSSISINGESYILASGGASVTSGIIGTDGTITLYQGTDDTTGITLTNAIHDYALVENPAENSNGTYTVGTDGTVKLTVQDQYNKSDTKEVTISGIASTDALDAAAAKATTAVIGSDNITVGDPTYDENDGHAIYKVELNDDITLSGQTDDGQSGSVSISGSTGSISVTTGTGDDASTITIGGGTITGLTNEITNWSAFVSSDSEAKNSTHAATLAELYELSQHSVLYDYKTDDDGNLLFTSITLKGPQYGFTGEGTNKSYYGGTLITNVAYADINGNGSAAVNVDLLKDYVSSEVTTATQNIQDQHLVANPDSTDGAYSVDKTNHDVTLKVDTGTKDADDKPVYSDVTIKDVASASEVGDVSSIHADLKNESGDTSVVDAINNLDDKVGSADFSSAKTEEVKKAENVTDAILALDDKVGTAVTEAGKHSTVSNGNGITVTNTNDPASADYDSTKGANYEVALADDFTLGDKEGQSGSITVTGSEGTISATGNIGAGSFTTTGGISIGNTDGTNVVSGLGNLSWDATHDYSQSGQAATEAQLQKATEAAVQYDRKDDGTVNKGSISLGYTNDAGEQQYTAIHNVAAGTDTYDAVNVGQLQQVENQVINNSMNINMLEGSIHRLDNRIDRVGAGAAALAALHPLDYDPDAKWDFAAGVGNYRSATATAIGAYYRPNEDVMFSVGGSFGGGENMVNAGVSFKLGSGSGHVTTSKAAMARELAAMKETVAQQSAQIEQQAAQIAELTALVQKLAGEAAASETDAEA